MGRKRTHEIKIRMTDEEYDAYQKRLERSKLSGNSFGIRCLLDKEIRVIEGLPDLLRELRALGNNMNQIARKLNANEMIIYPSEVKNVEPAVNAIWQFLKR